MKPSLGISAQVITTGSACVSFHVLAVLPLFGMSVLGLKTFEAGSEGAMWALFSVSVLFVVVIILFVFLRLDAAFGKIGRNSSILQEHGQQGER